MNDLLLSKRSLALLLASLSTALIAFLPATTREANAAFTPSAEGGAVAVTTDHAEATRAALETLHAGGNAVDAAITAALTLGVVNPIASGLGGGGFALIYMKGEQKVVALDFRETAPQGINVGEMLTRTGFGSPPGFRGLAVGVPGEPLGLELLSTRYGKRSLAADARPAADLAAHGFPLGKHMADGLSRFKDHVTVSPELARIFLPGGTPLGYRGVVQRPELARTILRFGAEGARSFYNGDIARKIVSAAHASGSPLTDADLAAYRVRERAPLTRTIGSRTIATMPAPSAGGLMLLEALEMYGADATSPLVPMGFGSSQYLHTLGEVFRGAIADRARSAGDPDLEPGVAAAYDRALAPDQIAARRMRIAPDKTHPAPDFKTLEQGTSHLIVADAEGNVVSMTTTVNGPFGARIIAGDTGVLLNDELTDFSKPQDIAGFGVVGLGPNRPRPAARPVSSMTPTIVIEGGVPILAVGGSGGPRIATNVTQATLARLVFGLDPSASVSAPRMYVSGGAAPEMMVEPEIAEDVRAGLRARGEQIKQEVMLSTAVHMVAWERKGPTVRVLAASDPRKSSLAVAQ